MGFMNILEFFSCYTKLPIHLNDICEQARTYGYVDEFRFSAVDIDPDILPGMMYMHKEMVNGSQKRIASIAFSSHISDVAFRRVVCCKEILHVFDDDEHTAKTREAVSDLVEYIAIPPIAGIPRSALSDHDGLLYALMVLMPRDALRILGPRYTTGDLSAEDVARLAQIPVAYARVALSDVWRKAVEKIT